MSDGTETWSFRYDADGLRTEATNGTVTYKYTYSGSSLAQLEISETAGSETTVTDTLYFAYDSTGPVSVTHNDVTYYYVTNLQGDIVAILNNSGTAVVTYTYDAWGNILSTSGSMASTLGALNPLRYRGYVFDTFSGFYYLQSRYYRPESGRFLNADAYASTGQGILGNNMFAYCGNNPCVYCDPFGYAGLVGVGLQFDVSTAHGTYGMEIVIYWDPEVVQSATNNPEDEVAIVMYTYSGVSVSLEELAIAPQLYEMTACLDFEDMKINESAQDEILITYMGLMTDFSLSGSVFVIYGYDDFKTPKDYSGEFETWSGSISKPGSTLSGGAYYSYAEKCWSFGVKVGVSAKPKLSPISIQYSHTYYSDPIILSR